MRKQDNHKTSKRLLCIVAVCCLVFGMIPGNAMGLDSTAEENLNGISNETVQSADGSTSDSFNESVDTEQKEGIEAETENTAEHQIEKLEGANVESEKTPEVVSSEQIQQKSLLGASAEPLRAAGGVPEGTTVLRDPWYPSVTSEANGWQIVDGDYRDGQHGATTQVTNTSKSVVIRKNILPTKDENIFTVALKVRTMASWADLLDATRFRLQNGNSDNSSKVNYFDILPRGSNSVPVDVYFMDAPNSVSENSLPGNYKVVYKKRYYVNPSISGKMFLYFNNPVIGMGDHGGQKDNVTSGKKYYVPIGTTMQSYEALHHAAVAMQVEDIMAPGVTYVEGSARNNTQIPGVSGRTSVSVSGNTLTWTIDDDGTIPVGQDYKIVKDTLNGKTTYYREYDLIYDVHLDASDPEFEPGRIYPTNDEDTHLDYTYDPRPTKEDSDYWNDFEESQSPMTFPIPSVKGTLYNLTFKKTDSKTGNPLPGAKFNLSGVYGASMVSGVTSVNSRYDISETSSFKTDDKGIITFENVPWGTYELKETEAPRGWDITFTGLTQKLCVTTTPNALDKKGEEYWLKPSLIGNNGTITNKPWPEGVLTLKKNITNYEDILSQSDKDTEFDLRITDFDASKIVFLDETGDVVDDEQILLAMLKNQETSEYTVRLKDGSGTFALSEMLPANSDLFAYQDTVMNKNRDNSDANGSAALRAGESTESAVTINAGNNITLTVNNKYRIGEVSLKKQDSVTGEGLDGAQFDVYTTEQADANTYAETIDHNGVTYYKLDRAQTSAEDGTFSFQKLPASSTRSYVIKEALPPKGYINMDALIPFNFDEDENVSIVAVDSDDINFDPSTRTIHVDNHKLYELPTAGGIGTYPFIFIGALIVTIAVIRSRNNVKSL